MNELPTPVFPVSLKRLFHIFDRLLFRLAEQPRNSLLFVLVLTFCLNGFRSTQTDYFKIAQSPFEPYNGVQYVQDSIFLPLSAYYLGLNQSQFQFDFYTICAYLLALALIYVFGHKKFRPELTLFLANTAALSPASLVSLSWPGMPDAFTILFSVLAVFSNSIPILFLAGLLGFSNHPQFILIAVSLSILRLAAREKDFKMEQAVALLAGTIAGYAMVQTFLSYYHIPIEINRLQAMFEYDVSFWLESKLLEAPLSLFSLYQGLWFILPVCVLYGFQRNPPYYILFLVLQAAAGAVTLFVLDTTRIFSLLTIGTLLHAVAFTYHTIEEEYRPSLRWLLTAILIAAIFLPRYVIMSGQMYMPPTSLIPYMILSLFSGT